MKRLMDRETVMILSMCLVLLVVMFGATVAWFEGSRPVSIMATDIEMDDLGDLYVWVKTDEPAPGESQNIDDEGYIPLPAIGVGDEVNHSIDLDITAQENIEDNTLAPGAYGTVKFKILSKTSRNIGYKLSITPDITMMDGFAGTGTSLTEEDFEKLFKTHLKFYLKYENGQYSEVIPYGDDCLFNYPLFKGTTGELEENVEKELTLYWYWPYEYTDIPASLNTKDTDSEYYEEFKKYNFMLDDAGNVVRDKTEAESIESYDWDDTYIGNYIQKVLFHFDVEAIRK